MPLTRLLHVPDRVWIQNDGAHQEAVSSAEGRRWGAAGVDLAIEPGRENVVTVTAPQGVARIHLRWRLAVPESWLWLGDAWERGYGDLAWRHLVPERVMPWYVLAHDGRRTHGLGVATGGSALAA